MTHMLRIIALDFKKTKQNKTGSESRPARKGNASLNCAAITKHHTMPGSGKGRVGANVSLGSPWLYTDLLGDSKLLGDWHISFVHGPYRMLWWPDRHCLWAAVPTESGNYESHLTVASTSEFQACWEAQASFCQHGTWGAKCQSVDGGLEVQRD